MPFETGDKEILDCQTMPLLSRSWPNDRNSGERLIRPISNTFVCLACQRLTCNSASDSYMSQMWKQLQSIDKKQGPLDLLEAAPSQSLLFFVWDDLQTDRSKDSHHKFPSYNICMSQCKKPTKPVTR